MSAADAAEIAAARQAVAETVATIDEQIAELERLLSARRAGQ